MESAYSARNQSNCNGTSRLHDIFVVSFWSVIGCFGLVTNVLIFIGICKNTRMRTATSYWLILSLACCDIGMLLVSITILVPSSYLHDSYMTVDSWINALLIFIYDLFWYTGVLHLALMAVNRYIGALYAIGLVVSVPGLFPCCNLVFDHCGYHAKYLQPETKYQYMDLVLNLISVIVMAFCYFGIVLRVRSTRVAMSKYRLMIRQSTQQRIIRYDDEADQADFRARDYGHTMSCIPLPSRFVSRRELRLVFQFSAVSTIFACTFLTWQILPRFTTSKWTGFFSTTLFFVNNCTNPTVYLIFNSTLWREVVRMLCPKSEKRVLNLPADCANLLLMPNLSYVACQQAARHQKASTNEDESTSDSSRHHVALISNNHYQPNMHRLDPQFGATGTTDISNVTGVTSLTDCSFSPSENIEYVDVE